MSDKDSPYISSASVLDRLRLGKQRAETKQLINSIETNSGWHNHPCSKQWAPYKLGLAVYGLAICSEWRSRGYKDTLLDYFNNKIDEYIANGISYSIENIYPPWLKDIASSHRAALLFKNYEYYKQFDWKEEPKLDYYWPTKVNNDQTKVPTKV